MPRCSFSAGALVVVAAGLCACGSSSTATSTPTPAAANTSSFCIQASALGTQIAGLGSALTSNTPGAVPNLTAIKQVITNGAAAVDSLESQAPAEIAAAVHTVRTAYDQASAAAQSVTSVDQITTVLAPFESTSVASAIAQVTTYIAVQCGITPPASTAAPTPTPT